MQAPGEGQVQEMFGVNAEVASLGLTTYVLGFAFGPLLCMSPRHVTSHAF